MGSEIAVRSVSCQTCPYRRDVPSGLWAFEEYEKLRAYDEPTFAQPFAGFSCHAARNHYCHGWAVVGSSRGHEFELLALRLRWPAGGVPEASVSLFASGCEAADYGQAEIDYPSEATRLAVGKLIRQHERLQQ